MFKISIASFAAALVALSVFIFSGSSQSASAFVVPAECGGGTFDTMVNVSGFYNGTPEREIIVGSAGDDVILGNAGSDCIIGAGGNDTLDGGSGNDRIFGGSGTDSVNGKSGIDVCDGESENNCEG